MADSDEPTKDSSAPSSGQNITNLVSNIPVSSKVTDETSHESDSKTRGPIDEGMLVSFENSLNRLRERSISDHAKRMNIVRMLAHGSGMDNQQQEHFVKEIDMLFRPPYNIS